MASWFYTDLLATQQGPVDESTLLELNRSGELKAKSLVWREGLDGWIPFREIAAEIFTRHTETSGDAVVAQEDSPKVAIGVCAHSGRVYRAAEMLPYGEALIGPESKNDFLQRLMEGGAESIADATEKTVEYVGFWWRSLSSLLDYLIKMIPSGLFMVPYYIVVMTAGVSGDEVDPDSFEGMTGGMTAMMAITYAFGVLGSLGFSIAYDTWMVGKYQGTLGKLIIGAKVVNPDGSRLTYKRAFVRWLAKKPLNYLLVWGPSMLGFALVVGLTAGLSARGEEAGASIVLGMMTGLFVLAALLALCSGVYWMAAFDPEKRALHDRVAATRVVKK